MVYYAKGIRKFGRELGIHVTDFPQFGLIGRFVEQEREPDNSLISGYGQTEKEIRHYEQREPDQEPDPRKEQEEYLERRRRECI